MNKKFFSTFLRLSGLETGSISEAEEFLFPEISPHNSDDQTGKPLPGPVVLKHGHVSDSICCWTPHQPFPIQKFWGSENLHF